MTVFTEEAILCSGAAKRNVQTKVMVNKVT
jgi:hypothetical protein